MNKKTIRIAGWALCLSMMIAGVGASVGSAFGPKGNEISQVKADSNETIDLSTDSYSSSSTTSVVWGATSLTMTLNKGTSQTNANNYLGGTNTQTRFYAGQYLTFAVADGYTITNVVFTATGASYSNLTAKTNCSVSKDEATNTITPTDGTANFEVSTSGNRMTSVTINYSTSDATKYTVTFVSNGGSESPASKEVVDGNTFTFPSAGTKDGYVFLGWSSNGGTTKYAAGATSPAVTAAIDYTAYWDQITGVTVTNTGFDTSYYDGGTWDWEGLTVSYTTEGGNGGDVANLTSSNFTFTPSSPSIGVTSVSVVASYCGVNSSALAIDGLTVTAAPQYTKATSAAQLFDGQTFLIGNSNGTKVAKAYESEGTYLGEGTTTCTNNVISESSRSSASGCVFTLGRKIVNSATVWTIFDGTYYLYAAGTATSGKNYVKGTTTLDSTCYWNIAVGNEGVLTVESVENTNTPYLRYNSGSTRFTCYNDSSSQASVYFYVTDTNSDGTSAATLFNNNYMHMSANVENQCLTYYPIAKPVWNAMSDDDKLQFSTNYAEAYARLGNWASANGDRIDGNMNLVTNGNSAFLSSRLGDGSSNLTLIAAIAGASLVALTGGVFLFRRKKEN